MLIDETEPKADKLVDDGISNVFPLRCAEHRARLGYQSVVILKTAQISR